MGGSGSRGFAANLPPAGLLMPTICVCNSSPGGQENTSKQTPGESSFAAPAPYLDPLNDPVAPEQQRTGAGHAGMKSGVGVKQGRLLSAYLTAVLITEGVQVTERPPLPPPFSIRMDESDI